MAIKVDGVLLNNKFFTQVDTSVFGPPPFPGVYAICVLSHIRAKERILYIGSSQNIYKRIMAMTHPYRILYNRFNELLVYTRCFECGDYEFVEKKLIQAYRPLLNKTHKGNG